MATQVEIGQAGEQIVNQWLRSNGYSTNLDTRLPGSTDIEAKSTNTSLLVQVKSSVQPSQPASLSADEERNIKSRATKLRYEAWEARVQLDARLQLVGQVIWRKLN